MIKLNECIDSEKLKEQLILLIPDIDKLNEFLINLNSLLTNDKPNNSEFYEKFINNFFLIYNEDIPFKNNIVIDDDILNEYKNGVINIKNYKLWELFNFSVYIGNEKYISYKNKENLNNEVKKNLIAIDEEGLFQKLLTKININDLAGEFLTINNAPAAMFLNDRIFLYSALLNYKKISIDLTITLKNKITNLIGSDLFNSWDSLREIFIKFIDFLDVGTIHY